MAFDSRYVPFADWLWLASLSFTVLSVRDAHGALFEPGILVGQVSNNDLVEISGLAVSRRNPGVLWVHNDRSRDVVYAVGTNGPLLATYRIGEDVDDFEDLALGPGPLPELQYLYCGDIGDNSATRDNIRVYRVAEPAIYASWAADPPSRDFALVEEFTLNYPDGAHNAEALMVDPLTGSMLIATKEGGISRIYRAERSQLVDGATITLSFLAQVDFHEVSAGDISPDGREIILRQENFASLWRRSPEQGIGAALVGEPFDVPVIGMPDEPNGEGVAFHGNGLGYFTISEGEAPAIYFFARTNGLSSSQSRTLLPAGSSWRYLDNGSDQGTGWRDAAFADTTWQSGRAQFGYGDDDEQTAIEFGPDKDTKHVTTYFRTQFQADQSVLLGTLTLVALFDDGIAVHLNGQEVLRRNLPANAGFSEVALQSGGSMENLWQAFPIANLLQTGTNVIAVEVHRRSRSEGDLSFDLQLLATATAEALQFAGPPRRLPETGWVLDVRGPTGIAVSVEGSSNLLDWIHLGDVSLANGIGSFTNTPASGSASSFYRLRR